MIRLIKLSIMLCLMSLGGFVPFVFAGEDTTGAIKGHIKRFEERFGIPIHYNDIIPGSDNIHFTLIAPGDYPLLNKYLDFFEEEINKYPPGFFKRRDVRSIALVERLFKGPIPAEGMYGKGKRVMIFDILRSDKNESYQRHSIHHEIFHMMAEQYPISELLNELDWSALNKYDFMYGKQEPLNKQNPVNPYAPNQLGFVTYYAMQSVDEDQAEVFACLMQKQHKKLIEEWQKKDDVLRRKIGIIKRFVTGYEPEMDEGYWRRLGE